MVTVLDFEYKVLPIERTTLKPKKGLLKSGETIPEAAHVGAEKFPCKHTNSERTSMELSYS